MFKAGDRDKRVVVVENKNMNDININFNVNNSNNNTNNRKKKNKRESGLDEYYLLSFNREGVEEKSENHELPNVPIFNLRTPHPHPPSLIGSPVVNRVVSPSSSSSFSSYNGSLSNGFWSPDDGSLYSFGHPEEPSDRYQALSPGGYHHLGGGVDLGNGDGRLVDELGLAQSFCGLNVGGEGLEKRKGFGVGPDGFLFGLGDRVCGVIGGGGSEIEGYGCYGGSSGLGNGGFGIGNSQVVSFGSDDGGVECRLNGFQGNGFGFGFSGSVGSYFGHDQASGLCSGSGWCNNQGGYLVDQRADQGCNWGSGEGINVLNGCNSVSGPYVNNGFVCSPQCTIDANAGRSPLDSLGSHFLVQPTLDLNGYSSLSKGMMLKGKPRAIANNDDSRTLLLRKGSGDLKGLGCEDGFITQSNGLHYVRNRGGDQLKVHRNVLFDEIAEQNQLERRVEFDGSSVHGSIENSQSLGSYSSLPTITSSNSLGEVQGYIYLMAHDQNGCRFLQKIFDEGTSKDVDVIFNELIDHTVELMLKPFGNYVIQKLLDVCTEDQRLQVVRAVTKEPGKLVGICLNTYGTRVVQKLIETLKTRQQITLVILALKPGFLDLIKDQNGNHVIQRCLQHLSNEDNKFIFDAAAKFCAEIATHQHGCCVMQRCIEHSTGKQRDKLIMEICKNGLFLAQDPYGNYVVQFVFDLKSPSVISNLPNVLSQFKGHYVNLSTQKCGSHVVEKCLRNFEESRSQIVRELLSVRPFDQLLQHEFANYVIQTALAVTKGPLHSSLVEAVRPHLNLRTSPYCKRIFSQTLFKK